MVVSSFCFRCCESWCTTFTTEALEFDCKEASSEWRPPSCDGIFLELLETTAKGLPATTTDNNNGNTTNANTNKKKKITFENFRTQLNSSEIW